MNSDGASKWQTFMDDARKRVHDGGVLEVRGTLTRLTGLVLEATGIRVPVGSQCMVSMKSQEPVLAEVVGFSNERAFLMPAGDVHGLSSGASVVPAAAYVAVPRLGESGGGDAGRRGIDQPEIEPRFGGIFNPGTDGVAEKAFRSADAPWDFFIWLGFQGHGRTAE